MSAGNCKSQSHLSLPRRLPCSLHGTFHISIVKREAHVEEENTAVTSGKIYHLLELSILRCTLQSLNL